MLTIPGFSFVWTVPTTMDDLAEVVLEAIDAADEGDILLIARTFPGNYEQITLACYAEEAR